RLGVIPVTGEKPGAAKTVWVQWDEKKYPYLAAVRWPKGGPLLVLVQNREQTEMLLLEADPATGKTKTLIRERDPAWVDLRRLPLHWLEDGSGFLWATERDGGPALELRTPNGRFRRVIVPARDGFQGLVDVDLKGDHIVYSASTDPTQSRLYRLSLTEG